MKVVYEYMKKAIKGNPNDANLKKLHDEVKDLYDKQQEELKKPDEEEKKSSPVVIEDYQPP